MRIVAISPGMGRAFQALGHEVFILWPKGPAVFNLAQELEKAAFAPELIFQEETLGPRIILSGLECFDCPKIFWSVDTHLNLFWHAPYSRLFDGLMSPHISILRRYPDILPPLPPYERLTMPGYEIPWKPFEERKRAIGFVGRVTKHRPSRQRMTEFLATAYQAELADNLDKQAMLEFYRDTRLAPNETIMYEVNFRLMESASCGCLSFNPDVGEDQNILFQPGREMEVYQHILELRELLDFHQSHLRQAEAKARLAWERVRQEHLPIHRAKAVLDFAGRLDRKAAKGQNALKQLTLTMFNLKQASRINIPVELLNKNFSAAGKTSSQVLSSRIMLLTEEKNHVEAAEAIAEIFSSPAHEKDFVLNATASLSAIKIGLWDMAKEFWYRHQRAHAAAPAKPFDPPDLYRLRAREFTRFDLSVMPGLGFDPNKHVPRCAFDCLLCALAEDNDSDRGLELKKQAWGLLSQIKGAEYMGIGYLSDLTLHFPENWRYGLHLAILNLRSFREKEGLEEAVLAFNQAAQKKALPAFKRSLSQLEPRGYLNGYLSKI